MILYFVLDRLFNLNKNTCFIICLKILFNFNKNAISLHITPSKLDKARLKKVDEIVLGSPQSRPLGQYALEVPQGRAVEADVIVFDLQVFDLDGSRSPDAEDVADALILFGALEVEKQRVNPHLLQSMDFL